MGLSAARGVEEPAGPHGWLKREEKLGLKGGKRSGLSPSGGWGQARHAE